jgi:hypothetical protein
MFCQERIILLKSNNARTSGTKQSPENQEIIEEVAVAQYLAYRVRHNYSPVLYRSSL